MKKLNITILLLFIGLGVFAQEPNKYQVKRAKFFTNYISGQMDLNEEQTSVIYDALLNRIVSASKRIKADPDLKAEGKRAIYRSEFNIAFKAVSEKLGPKMARKAMTLSSEARLKLDKK